MLSTIGEILEDLRQGRAVILVDDEDRENEGDLVCAAEKVTPEIINFMTRHTPGYICVALTAADCDRLELHPQAMANTSLRSTAMAVSVDGHPRHGVGTGIPTTSCGPATWCRCAPATAACSCERARPRARST